MFERLIWPSPLRSQIVFESSLPPVRLKRPSDWWFRRSKVRSPEFVSNLESQIFPMSFATLIGNDRNKDILKRLLGRHRIGAALILAGPDAVGKRQFALTMAKAANCQKSPSSGFAT